jgi:hypothetical protein
MAMSSFKVYDVQGAVDVLQEHLTVIMRPSKLQFSRNKQSADAIRALFFQLCKFPKNTIVFVPTEVTE